jgi:hypothetical protein
VPAGNEPALRAALRSLLADPMARAQASAAAWGRSRAFPTWAEAAPRFRKSLAALHPQVAEEP